MDSIRGRFHIIIHLAIFEASAEKSFTLSSSTLHHDAAKVRVFRFQLPCLPLPFLPRCTQKGTFDGTLVAGLALRIQAVLLPTLLRNSNPGMWLVQAAADACALRSASHHNAVPMNCTVKRAAETNLPNPIGLSLRR